MRRYLPNSESCSLPAHQYTWESELLERKKPEYKGARSETFACMGTCLCASCVVVSRIDWDNNTQSFKNVLFYSAEKTAKSLFFQPMRERSVECTAEAVHKYFFAFTWKAIQASNVTSSKVGTTMNPRSKWLFNIHRADPCVVLSSFEEFVQLFGNKLPKKPLTTLR